MSATWGKHLRLAIFGEARSPAVGIVIDGLPPGLKLDDDIIWRDMARRSPGTGPFAVMGRDADTVRVISGLHFGRTQGTPLCAIIENEEARSSDYDDFADTPRPGHADYTAGIRFGGHADLRGSGHFSGRLTAPLVFAGAVARIALGGVGMHVGGHIQSIGHIKDVRFDPVDILPETFEDLRVMPIPTLDRDAAEQIRESVLGIRAEGDSLGGVLEVAATGIPPGMGAPFFDSLESSAASLLFSIPGVKGVEFGEGFSMAAMRGSDANDPFVYEDGAVRTTTNNNGGLLGGITTGMPVILRVAVKPTPTINKPQSTVRLSTMRPETVESRASRDPCVALRALAVAEAALLIALMDAALERGLL